MKNNKKMYYIIGTILLIFIIILIFSIMNNNKSDLKKQTLLAIGNDALFLRKNNSWYNISNSNKIDYNWNTFDIYSNTSNIGKYSMIYSGVWNIMGKDNLRKDDLSFNDMFGISTKLKYQVYTFKNEINNQIDNNIKTVLNNNNIPINTNLTSNNIISIDIDNDLKEEKIYTITNIFSETEENTTFGFIFLVDDNNIYMIENNIYENDNLSDTCKPYVANILDLENRKYLVINCAYYSDIGKRVSLYYYKKNNFKEMISN